LRNYSKELSFHPNGEGAGARVWQDGSNPICHCSPPCPCRSANNGVVVPKARRKEVRVKMGAGDRPVKNGRSSVLTLACLRVNIGHQGLNRLQWMSTIPTESYNKPIQVTIDLLHARPYPEQTTARLGGLLQVLYTIATIHDNIQRVLPDIPTGTRHTSV
jgi:hypothetical protein